MLQLHLYSAMSYIMITGHTVIHRAREVRIVPSGGKWRFESKHVPVFESMFQFSEHGRPSFPRNTTKVKMKSCVNYWCDILVPKDTPIVISSCAVYPIA